EDPILLERARTIAQAELELARVRRVKVALIERASAFGELDSPQAFSSVTQIIRLLNAIDRGRVPSFPEPVDSSATMPSQEPDGPAEAIRRVLPELRKLDRLRAPRCLAARPGGCSLQLLAVFGQTKPIFFNLSNGLMVGRCVLKSSSPTALVCRRHALAL